MPILKAPTSSRSARTLASARAGLPEGECNAMLTRKQHELLMFIDGHLKSTGFSPSFEEMKQALGLRSKSGIHRLISALEERGFLLRRHHRARALEVARLPEDTTPRAETTATQQDSVASGNFAPNVIRGDFTGRLPGVRAANEAPAVQLPLYGRIAAGLHSEALRDQGAQIEVPMALLGSGEHYALEVAGDSMVDAGILDGDRVAVHRTSEVRSRQIVVARLENEVTVKRYRQEGSVVWLMPENAEFEPIKVDLKEEPLLIEGIVVGVVRRGRGGPARPGPGGGGQKQGPGAAPGGGPGGRRRPASRPAPNR